MSPITLTRSKTCVICKKRYFRQNCTKRKFMTRFPLDEDRCKEWVKVIGIEDFAYVPIEKLHVLKYVCGDHFRSKDFNKKKTRLKKWAVPSILINVPPLSDHMLAEFPCHIAKSAPSSPAGKISTPEVPDPIRHDHNYLRLQDERQHYIGKDQIPLHLFPNPAKDHDRFLLWTFKIGGNVLSLNEEYVFKRRRVCRKHFEGKYHASPCTLFRNAIPTLLKPESEPDPLQLPEEPKDDDDDVETQAGDDDDSCSSQVDDKSVGVAADKCQDDEMVVEYLDDDEEALDMMKDPDGNDDQSARKTSATYSNARRHRAEHSAAIDIKLCRACLSSRAPLLPLPGLPATRNLLPEATGPRPNWMCLECASEMKSAVSFIERARRAEDAMLRVAQGDTLTIEDILKIDREEHRLTSRYQYVYDGNGRLTLQEMLKTTKVEPSLVKMAVTKLEDNTEEGNAVEGSTVDGNTVEHSRDECQESDITDNTFDAINDVHDPGVNFGDLTESNKISLFITGKDNKLKNMSLSQRELSEFLAFNKKTKKSTKQNESSGNKKRQIELQNKMAEYFTVTVYNTLEERIAELRRRQHNPSYVHAPRKCEMCYLGFLDSVTYDLHMHKHTESCGEFKCAVCQYRCVSKERLRQHNFRHSRKFSCKLCTFESQDKYRATLHMRFHEGKTYKCKHCDKVFNHIVNLHNHIRAKHPSDNVCPLCGYSFIGERGLATHRALTHSHDHRPIPEDGPSCEECRVKFATDAALHMHMNVSPRHNHTVDKLISNSDVPSFKKRNYHELHRTLSASGKPAKKKIVRLSGGVRTEKREITLTKFSEPVPCEKCAVPISSASEYHHHFKQEHANEKRTWYPEGTHSRLCPLCGKLLRNTMYKDHMLEHEGVMFKCDTCGKQYKRKLNMILHSRIHLGERFPCSKCGKLFNHMGNRDRHEQYVHTESKDFKCLQCGKCFKNAGARKLHVDHVHLRKPYKRRNRQRGSTRAQSEVAASKQDEPTALYRDESATVWE